MGSVLARISQRLRNGLRPAPRALILAYHRIATPQSDPWAMTTRPEDFAEHLEVIRSEWNALSLTELTRALRDGKNFDGSVAITFDDGYADNLHVAKPMLERAKVPATAFLCSGAVDNPRLFWWDELTRILLRPGKLPERLELAGPDKPFVRNLEEGCEYTDADAERHRGWRGWEEPTHPRHQLYAQLWAWLRSVPDSVRSSALQELTRWAEADSKPQESDRPLNAAEIRQLATGGLVDVGAHTVNHPRLSTLRPAEQAAEIVQSKERLEDVTGRRVTAFAYPFGGSADYDAESVQLVKAAGFGCACAVANSAVTNTADPYQLPRLYAQGWDGEQFARIISSLLGKRRRRLRASR